MFAYQWSMLNILEILLFLENYKHTTVYGISSVKWCQCRNVMIEQAHKLMHHSQAITERRITAILI